MTVAWGLGALAQAPAGGAEDGRAAWTHGQDIFQAHCASCHDPAQGRAPPKSALAERSAGDVVAALKSGAMAPMASGLSDADIAAVATYLTAGRPVRQITLAADPAPCDHPGRFSKAGPRWNGWSPDPKNWRMQADPGLSAADLPRLKLKWALAYPGGRYGAPAFVGGRLFLTSNSGKIYSLDAQTGCLIWRFDDPGGARTTISVGPLARAPSGYAAYFGDLKRNVYALDAASGALIWKVQVAAHPLAVLTGSPVLFKDRLYVPISSYEEGTGRLADYGCCTFRGSVVAIDVTTGRMLWRTYAIDDAPKPTGKNTAGVQMFGPAGAAIWSAPTIDAKRGVLYAATGDSYTDTPEGGSDSIMAVDLVTGKVRWRTQVTMGDNYVMGCGPTANGANCPSPVGPDADFGASPILLTLPGGKDVVLAGQKSGTVYGFDPDNGKILWRTQVGAGGPLGGIEWGMAADGKRLYVANADPFSPSGAARPGLYALDPATGTVLWSQPTPKAACGWVTTRCGHAQSAAPTAIPGVVFADSSDGHMRAYAAKSGEVLWDFDVGGGRYPTVNGVADQPGGTLDVVGPTVAGGMVLVMSGYQGPIGGSADTALLVFSKDGK
jgi:polyvinyl alcohol dehydrogenase (cytochrome)